MKTDLRSALVLVVISLGACSSPPTEPINEGKLVARLESRQDKEVLAKALSLASWEELSFLGQSWEEELNDFGQATYWQASALAYEANIRDARQELESSLGRADSAGFPRAIGLSGRAADFDQLDFSTELRATVDLLGILGLGPAAAARELAEAQVRTAYGRLEVAAWQGTYRVLTQLVSLAAVRGELSDLRKQAKEANEGLHRADVLLKTGRLGLAPVSRIRTFVQSQLVRIAEVEAQETNLIAALALASGQLPDASALSAPSPESLASVRRFLDSRPTRTTLGDLLQRHPEVRQRRLEYAVSEAQLRRVAVERWPRIDVGPRFDIRPSDLLTGGVIGLSLPWPGSLDGVIEAALADRKNARQRLEDTLLRVKNRLEASASNYRTFDDALKSSALAAYESSQQTWRGMQAMFAIQESTWDLWTDALMLRRNAIAQYWRTQGQTLLARIELIQNGSQMGALHE